MKMDPVVHFEMPAEDRKRMSGFYRKAFGWQTNQLGLEMGEWMRMPYDWSEDVKKLTMPVMLIYGDSDMFRPEHIVKFYQLLGGGLKDAGWMREHMSQTRLAILPNLTHYEIGSAPELAGTVLPFLDGGHRNRSKGE